MTQFDPYHQWLGIRDPERPPNHYRLLGLELFESNPDVIEMAADRQMAHLRTFQSGKNSELSQRLLNELSTAKLCLLNEQSRIAYDAKLTQFIDAPPSVTKEAVTFDAPDEFKATGDIKIDADDRASISLKRPRRAKPWNAWLIGFLSLLGLAAAAIAILRPWQSTSSTDQQQTANRTADKSPTANGDEALGKPQTDGPQETPGNDAGNAASTPSVNDTSAPQSRSTIKEGSGSGSDTRSVQPIQPKSRNPITNTPVRNVKVAPWDLPIKKAQPFEIESAETDVGSFALALSGRDVKTARAIFDSRIQTSQLTADEKSLLESMLISHESFWDTVQHSSLNMRQGSQIEFRGQTVNVLSKDRRGIKLLAKNQKSKTFRDAPKQIDPDLAIALVLHGLRDSQPTAWRLIGSFLAVDSKGDLELANKYWQRSKQNGAASTLEEDALQLLKLQTGSAPPLSNQTSSDPSKLTAANRDPPQTPDLAEEIDDSRFAVPTRSAIRLASRNLRQEKPQWFSSKSRDGFLETIDRLFEYASDDELNPNMRYAALDQARMIGLKQQEVSAVLQSVIKIDRIFSTKLFDELTSVVNQLQPRSRSAADEIFDATLLIARQEFQALNFSTTVTLLKFAESHGKSALQLEQLGTFQRRFDEANALQKNADDAKKVLASNDKDAAANQQVGLYYCFVQDDFRRGLPHLVKGNDRSLQQLALADTLAMGRSRPNRRLSEAWGKLSESYEGLIQEGMLRRAKFWNSSDAFGAAVRALAALAQCHLL